MAKDKKKPTETQKSQADEPQLSLRDEIDSEIKADLKETLADDATDAKTESIEKLQEERDKFEDKYLRAAAEVANMSNRFNKERADLLKYDGQKLASAVLPVLDNLERALAADAESDDAKAIQQGVEMVYGHLESALKDNHVTEIVLDEDKHFDPTVHQAVQTVPADDDHPKDTVVQVLQKGYRLQDRILRPVMVVVAN